MVRIVWKTRKASDVEHLSPFLRCEFRVITVENGVWFQVTFAAHLAYTPQRGDFPIMRTGLIGMINCLIFGSQKRKQRFHITLCTSVQSCAFTALRMQGHQVLFLSNTDCSLFARVLTLFEVEKWRWRRERVWILHCWQHTHTHTNTHLLLAFWRASNHLLWWMER